MAGDLRDQLDRAVHSVHDRFVDLDHVVRDERTQALERGLRPVYTITFEGNDDRHGPLPVS